MFVFFVTCERQQLHTLTQNAPGESLFLPGEFPPKKIRCVPCALCTAQAVLGFSDTAKNA
jgi:hypothetical protein